MKSINILGHLIIKVLKEFEMSIEFSYKRLYGKNENFKKESHKAK